MKKRDRGISGMKKRALFLAASLALSAFAFSGCGDTDTEEDAFEDDMEELDEEELEELAGVGDEEVTALDEDEITEEMEDAASQLEDSVDGEDQIITEEMIDAEVQEELEEAGFADVGN